MGLTARVKVAGWDIATLEVALDDIRDCIFKENG
jgi:hypothetical protein